MLLKHWGCFCANESRRHFHSWSVFHEISEGIGGMWSWEAEAAVSKGGYKSKRTQIRELECILGDRLSCHSKELLARSCDAGEDGIVSSHGCLPLDKCGRVERRVCAGQFRGLICSG